MNKKGWIALIAGLTIVCCCATVGVSGAAVYLLRSNASAFPARNTPEPSLFETEVPASPTRTPRPIQRTPLATPESNVGTIAESGFISNDTLDKVSNAVLPREDLNELAVRYKGVNPADTEINCETIKDTYAIGATRSITLSNQDDDSQFEVTVKLEYKTANVYMWVETTPKRVRLNLAKLKSAADDFQDKIYTTNRDFFGSETQPGVDCDNHIHVLHVQGVGTSVGGYFSSPDFYPRAVRSDSNEGQFFVMHAAPGYNGSDPGGVSYMSTMAHEFQHMISYSGVHAGNLWLEEGAAQFAERLNGYADEIGTDDDFASTPETQLNTWSESSAGENSAHYGAGYLFWSYVYDRFGEALTKKLARNPERNAGAFMKILADEGITNPDTDQPLTFEELFADFVLANYMNQTKIEDAAAGGSGGNRYNYASIDVPQMAMRGNFTRNDYPLDVKETLNQFGTHYFEFQGNKEVSLAFTGSTVVPLLPMETTPDNTFWYSMRADASNPRLTKAIDLSTLKKGDKATLTFKAWYRFEKDYDYGYASVSTDEGTTWTLLNTTTCTTENPQNANLGCGYTGPSGGDEPAWVDEEADLSAYAGETILLRFESVSDAGVNREGMAIDDLAIDEINWTDDASADDDWTAEGFVRVSNDMPQNWAVQLILEKKDGSYSLQRLALTDGAGNTQLDFGGDVKRAVLAVSPITQVTTEQAPYEIQVK